MAVPCGTSGEDGRQLLEAALSPTSRSAALAPSLKRTLSDNGKRLLSKIGGNAFARGERVEVLAPDQSEWLGGRILSVEEDCCSVELCRGLQVVSRVPFARVRRCEITSRFLPPRYLRTTARPSGPFVKLPADRKWVSSLRIESTSLRMARFDLADLHAFAMQQVERDARLEDDPLSPGQRGRSFHVLHAESVLSLPLLQRWKARAKRLRVEGSVAPMLAYHATSQSNLDAIAEIGLLAPGDLCERTGAMLPVAHGAAWGPGVYLGMTLHKSDMYAAGATDSYDRRQVLVCLAAPGKLDTPQPPALVGRSSTEKEKRRYARAMEAFHIDLDRPSCDGVFFNGTNARLSCDGSELILACSEQCLPLLLVTYEPRLAINHRVCRTVYLRTTGGVGARGAPWWKVDNARKEPCRGSVGAVVARPLLAMSKPKSLISKSSQTIPLTSQSEQLWSVHLPSSLLGSCRPRDIWHKSLRVVFVLGALSPASRPALREAAAGLVHKLKPTEVSAVGVAGLTLSSWSSRSSVAGLFGSGNGANGGVVRLLHEAAYDAAVLAVDRLQRIRRSREIAALAEAERRLYRTPQMPSFTAKKSPAQFARQLVLAIADHATTLGDMGSSGRFAQLQRATRRRVADEATQDSFVFVLVVGESSNPNDDERVMADKSMKRARKLLQGARVRSICRLLCLDQKGIDLRGSLLARDTLNTVPRCWVRKDIYLANDAEGDNGIRIAMRSLGDDLLLAANDELGQTLRISVPFLDRHQYQGIVKDLTKPPTWESELLVRPGKPLSVLIRGRLPRSLNVGQREMPIALPSGFDESGHQTKKTKVDKGKAEEHNSGAQPDLVLARLELVLTRSESELVMLQNVSSSLLSKAASGLKIDSPIRTLRRLVNAARKAVWRGHGVPVESEDEDSKFLGGLVLQTLLKLPPFNRATFTRRLRRVIDELSATVNTIEAASAAYYADQQTLGGGRTVKWLVSAGDMRFGAAALKRAAGRDRQLKSEEDKPEARTAQALSEIGSLATVASEGRSSSLAAAVGEALQLSNVMLLALGKSSNRRSNFCALTVADLMTAIGMPGVAIRVRRSDAAVVEPWLIVVERVSESIIGTQIAMSALACGAPVRSLCFDYTETRELQLESTPDSLVLCEGCTDDPEPVRRFCSTALHRAYQAVVFARNPAVQLSSQRLALLGVSFVRGCEQLLRRKMATRKRFLSSIEGENTVLRAIDIVLRLRLAIRAEFGQHDPRRRGVLRKKWMYIVSRLRDPNPHLWMTEASPGSSESDDGVDGGPASVCQLLVALCCFDELTGSLFREFEDTASTSSTALARVAMAMLAEATSRTCRVVVRRETRKGSADHGGGVYRKLLRKALGITAESCTHPNPDGVADDSNALKPSHHDGSFDLERGRVASNNFFASTNLDTNCSPWAIVATIGVARAIASQSGTRQGTRSTHELASLIASSLDDRTISMRSFLRDYMPASTSGRAVQVALYAQGLRYHRAKDRLQAFAAAAAAEAGSTHSAGCKHPGAPLFSSPGAADRILETLAQEERCQVYIERLQAKHRRAALAMKEFKGAARYARQLAEQNLFLATHATFPKLFNHAEVERLNSMRPPHDQLELLDTGLLKHHCAFPDCPAFLVSQATDRDKVLGTREGLFRHLAPLIKPERHYMRSLHLIAHSLLARSNWKMGRETFVTKLLNALHEEPYVQRIERAKMKDELRVLWLTFQQRFSAGSHS